MTKHIDTATQFLDRLHRGDFGRSTEDQASALAVVLAGAAAGNLAAFGETHQAMRAALEKVAEETEFADHDGMPISTALSAVASCRAHAARALRA